MFKFRIFWLGIPLAIIGVDQTAKLITRNVGKGQLNYGGILGLLEGSGWTIATLVLILVLLPLIRRINGPEKLAWIIIWASGLSNLIDRLLYGGVWDWIYYPYINVVGNLADIFLGLGALYLLLLKFRPKRA